MYQPNSECIGFCNWLLNLSKQKLSGPQRSLINVVYNAAITVTPVSDQEWYNFNLFTPWRNKYYLVFKDYATFIAPSLANGNIVGFNLDGNSNDTVGTNNGSDTNIIYGPAYGKIDQGALFDGSTSRIDITPFDSTLSYTIAFWCMPAASVQPLGAIISNGAAGTGIYYEPSSQRVLYFNGSAHYAPTVLSTTSMNSVVATCELGLMSIYVNGSLSVSGINAPTPITIASIGGAVSVFYFSGALDIVNVWDVPLSPQDAALFWNGGSGIQGPF